MRPSRLLPILLLAITAPTLSTTAADPSAEAPPEWLARPLSLVDALNIALERNSALLKARSDLEAAHGVVLQTRAVALPKLRATGNYQWTDQLEELRLGPPIDQEVSFSRENQWTAGIQLVQSLYEGGRIRSALRSARLTREQAELIYQTAVADTVLQVRTGYHDALLAAQQIRVQEESLSLLEEELHITRRREAAGTVPRFNVLRAEVEVANARPLLIRAQNADRIARNNLVTLLGYDVPASHWNNLPLQLTDSLEPTRQSISLQDALTQAAERRPELGALRKTETLRRENITAARAGYLPSLQVFAGHSWRSSTFQEDLASDVSGWNAGAQVSWNLFDGMLTYGKLREARALHRKAEHDLDDAHRRIALEVRTAYSAYLEASEVLDSQVKVQEQAAEALRLANVRAEAGAGIQLDVLGARTALTQARTTRIVAQRDYLVALAQLERAVGMTRHDSPR